MTFGVGDEDGGAVVEEDGGDVAEIGAGLLVDENLSGGVGVEIEARDGRVGEERQKGEKGDHGERIPGYSFGV